MRSNLLYLAVWAAMLAYFTRNDPPRHVSPMLAATAIYSATLWIAICAAVWLWRRYRIVRVDTGDPHATL